MRRAGGCSWVDIEGRALHVFDPAAGADRTVELDDRVVATAPIAGDRVLVALADRLATVDLAGERSRRSSRCRTRPTSARTTAPAIRRDDCGWSMALDERPRAGALYRFAGGALERSSTA